MGKGRWLVTVVVVPLLLSFLAIPVLLQAGDGNEKQSHVVTGDPFLAPSGDEGGNANVSEGLENFIPPQDDENNIEVLPMLGNSADNPRVNVMPGKGVGRGAPYAWPGHSLIIWGNVHNGTPPYTYTWDFGDGSAPVSGTVSNPKYINVTHAYATIGDKNAVLTVTDADGNFDVDTVKIQVRSYEREVEVNAAIENGLRYLYLHQQADGRWDYSSYDVAATAQAVLCFENQGYIPTDDYDKDIYAEYVKAGLDYITAHLGSVSIGMQGAGDPEEDAPGNTDHNGIGVYPAASQPVYTVGMVLMAMVSSNAPNMVAPNGPVNVVGRTYYDIVVDMVDWCAWAQNEPTSSCRRGGWRYSANYGSSDNSVSQWPAIGLEAAETNWGIEAPPFVKSELLSWINTSQLGDGRFYYICWRWAAGPMAVTGAGVCEMAYVDIQSSEARFQNSLSYLENHLNSSNGFYYAMYSISKGCRIADPPVNAMPGGLDWYDSYCTYLLATQNADGSWPVHYWGLMDTEWAILVLEQNVHLSPVAVINAPDSVAPGVPFDVDGSGSYHPSSDREIVEWLWDFDKDDGVDWDNPDTDVVAFSHPGYSLPDSVFADTHTISLRVADDGGPTGDTLFGTAEHTVIVSRVNHAPIADAGGPYSGKVGDLICLDATGSHDDDSGDYIAAYFWDVDGNGCFPPPYDTCNDPMDCTDSVCCRVWSYEYSGYVGLVVRDKWGAYSDEASAYVKIDISWVDVGVEDADISFSGGGAIDDTITVTAAIHAVADVDTTLPPVRVRFYDGDPSISGWTQIGNDQIIYDMDSGDVEIVQAQFVCEDTSTHDIFVVVDPDDELSEFDEHNNVASKTFECAGCDDATLIIVPDPMYIFYANNVTDKRAYIYFGDWTNGYEPHDIVENTVRVNDSLVPTMFEILPTEPLFPGENLRIRIDIRPFLLGYGWVWDTSYVAYSVTGKYTDSTEFAACGTFELFGHITGDVNMDNEVNVTDIGVLVDFLFNGGQLPGDIRAADVDHNGIVNVGDLSELIAIIFM